MIELRLRKINVFEPLIGGVFNWAERANVPFSMSIARISYYGGRRYSGQTYGLLLIIRPV